MYELFPTPKVTSNDRLFFALSLLSSLKNVTLWGCAKGGCCECGSMGYCKGELIDLGVTQGALEAKI